MSEKKLNISYAVTDAQDKRIRARALKLTGGNITAYINLCIEFFEVNNPIKNINYPPEKLEKMIETVLTKKKGK